MKAFDIGLIAFAVGMTAFTLHTFTPGAGPAPAVEPGPFTAVVIHDSAHALPEPEGPGVPPFPWHFLVKRDGTVARGVLWRDRVPAGRSGLAELDREALAICLEGDLDRAAPSRAQCRELVALLDRLCTESGIDPERVMTHAEMNPGKACPGAGLPAEPLREALRRRRAGLTEAPSPSSGRRPVASR